MSVTPSECKDIPGVYSVCINDICMSIQNFGASNELMKYDTNKDCSIDKNDFGGDEGATATVYVNAMKSALPDDTKWQNFTAEKLFSFTNWLRNTTRLSDDMNRIQAQQYDLVGKVCAAPGCTYFVHSYAFSIWRDVIVPIVGENGELFTSNLDRTCDSFSDLLNALDIKPDRFDMYEENITTDKVVNAFSAELPDELDIGIEHYLSLFSTFEETDILASVKYLRIECGGDGCPEDSKMEIRAECKASD